MISNFTLLLIGSYFFLTIISFLLAIIIECNIGPGIVSNLNIPILFIPIVNFILVIFLSLKVYFKKRDILKYNKRYIDYEERYFTLVQCLSERDILTTEQINDLIDSKYVLDKLRV